MPYNPSEPTEKIIDKLKNCPRQICSTVVPNAILDAAIARLEGLGGERKEPETPKIGEVFCFVNSYRTVSWAKWTGRNDSTKRDRKSVV